MSIASMNVAGKASEISEGHFVCRVDICAVIFIDRETFTFSS